MGISPDPAWSAGEGDAERRRRSEVTGGEPILDFSGTSTPYIDYQSIDVLLSLQHLRSGAPAELSFYIMGQVKELLFKLLYEELCRVRSRLDAGEVDQAVWELQRVRRVEELLCACWDVLSTLTPDEFNSFRDHLGQASGLQSYMYRMVEFALGNKRSALARPHRHVPGIGAQVDQALHSASVYDAALAYLHRSGFPIAEHILGRDVSEPYEPHPSVEEAWADVYRKGGPADPLYRLAEALMGVAEGFSRWRALHLLTVERIIGVKPGTGGTYGVAWLRGAAEYRFFPELWSARNAL